MSTPTAPLQVAVLGAGAVGCFYGGMLARAGHRVTLIGRPQHVQVFEAQGLRMQTLAFDETVKLHASTEASAVTGADLVLFAVKSPDTETAGAQMREHLKPGALVLCLQNGVDNAERLRAVLPGVQVAAAVVYVATEMAGPGHLRHHGRGELVIEPSPASERVAQALAAAGVPTEISDNVRGALWAKLILNCAYNALSAVGRIPYGELVQQPGVTDVMRDAGGRVPRGGRGRRRDLARRRGRRRAPHRRDHALAVLVHRAGPDARQAQRDRPPQRPRRAPRRGAGCAHTRQPRAVGGGETGGSRHAPLTTAIAHRQF